MLVGRGHCVGPSGCRAARSEYHWWVWGGATFRPSRTIPTRPGSRRTPGFQSLVGPLFPRSHVVPLGYFLLSPSPSLSPTPRERGRARPPRPKPSVTAVSNVPSVGTHHHVMEDGSVTFMIPQAIRTSTSPAAHSTTKSARLDSNEPTVAAAARVDRLGPGDRAGASARCATVGSLRTASQRPSRRALGDASPPHYRSESRPVGPIPPGPEERLSRTTLYLRVSRVVRVRRNLDPPSPVRLRHAGPPVTGLGSSTVTCRSPPLSGPSNLGRRLSASTYR